MSHLERVPEAIREDLKNFVEHMRREAGDALVSILLYGEVAKKGEYVPLRTELYA